MRVELLSRKIRITICSRYKWRNCIKQIMLTALTNVYGTNVTCYLDYNQGIYIQRHDTPKSGSTRSCVLKMYVSALHEPMRSNSNCYGNGRNK